MKPFVITAALAAMCALGASAEVLTPAQALARLDSQSTPAAVRRAPALRQSVPALTVNDPEGQPALYVMGNSVILSADSEAMPLIGIADSQFDPANVPPAMREMLDGYADEIGQLRAGLTAAVAAPSRAADLAAVEPLCPTIWDQGAPYNAFCPDIDGVQAPTGCVATAIAQVLYTYKYPERLTSDISYAKGDKTYKLTAAECGDFGWSDMKQTYGAADDATPVARLMQACGYAASMNYGAQVSGANMTVLLSGLLNYFDYDRTMRMENRDWYTLDQWQQIIWDELAQGYPVCYSGSAPSGGSHAFVVDGYKSDGYFHLNWGWGGQGNGYFLLSALNPSSQGIGGYAGGYNRAQQAILGIRTGHNTPASEIEPVMEIADSYNMEDGNLGAKVRFSGGFRNPSMKLTVAATLRFKFAPVGGGQTYYANTNVSVAEHDYFRGAMTGTIEVTLPSEMADGKYDVSPMTYVPSIDRDYPTRISPTQVLQCTVSGGTAKFSKLTADVKAERVEVLSPLVPGFTFKARFTAVNSSDIPFSNTLKIRLQDADGNILADADGNAYMTTQSVYIEGNSSLIVDVEQQGTTFKSAKAGTYYLVVCDNNEIPISTPLEVEVRYGAQPGVLECTGVRFTSRSKTNVRVELDLKCLPDAYGATTYYAGPVQYTLSGAGTSSDPVTSESVFIEMNNTVTVELALSVPLGTVGETYTGVGKYLKDGGAIAMTGSYGSFVLEADPEPEVPEIPVVTAPKLECTSLECTSAVKGALAFKATVRNSGTDYEGPLYMQIYDEKGSPESIDAPFLTHNSIKLEGNGKEHVITFTPTMSWGNSGRKYSAVAMWKHPETGKPTAIAGNKNEAVFYMTDTSGIAEVSAEGAAGLQLYDLQGRRVASPRRGGIYLTSDGRKFRL